MRVERDGSTHTWQSGPRCNALRVLHRTKAVVACLFRLEMAKAALGVKCDPNEISFIRAFHVIQYELRWAAATRAQGKLPSLLKRLRKRLADLLNEERPGRKFDRAVKALPQRYTVCVLKKDLS